MKRQFLRAEESDNYLLFRLGFTIYTRCRINRLICAVIKTFSNEWAITQLHGAGCDQYAFSAKILFGRNNFRVIYFVMSLLFSTFLFSI